MPPDKDKDKTDEVQPDVAPDDEGDEFEGQPYDDADDLDAGESPDKIDAVLRDPDVPGDVRAFFVTMHAVNTYLDTHEFYKDDAGMTQVRVKPPAEEA